MSTTDSKLNSIRQEIIEKKKDNSIESVLQSLEKCDDKKIKSLIKTIKNIYNLTNDSYTISNKLTTDINNLKTISTPNKDLQNTDIDNINKLIEELKKEVKGNEDNSKIGLSNSYLMVLSSVIKYAEKIKCPPKLSEIDTIIQYFYNWSRTHAKKWKKDHKDNKYTFKINTIIFPLYVIIKIIIHTHLYKHPTGNVSRSAEFSLRLNDYLVGNSNDNEQQFNDVKFIPFLNMYLNPIIKKDIENKTIQLKNISNIPEKTIRPFLNFIENFEKLLEILSKIEKKEFYNQHILKGDVSLKSFKDNFYNSILRTKRPDRVGPHFRFGGNIPQSTNKGFRKFYNQLRYKFRSTNINTRSIQAPRNRPRIEAWGDNNPKRPTRKAPTPEPNIRVKQNIPNPPLRVKTPNLGNNRRRRPPRQAPRLLDNGVTNFEENMAKELLRERQRQRNEDKIKYGTLPKIQPSNKYPPTYDPSNRNPKYSDKQRNRALGVNRQLPDLRSLGKDFQERNKEVNKLYKKERFNNNNVDPKTKQGQNIYGGSKTKKKKRKKRNTTTNKKKNKKKKHTKRYKKKHNKKRYTKKNK